MPAWRIPSLRTLTPPAPSGCPSAHRTNAPATVRPLPALPCAPGNAPPRPPLGDVAGVDRFIHMRDRAWY
eukprot:454508-Prorocentrum_minimum.AAC.1